MLDDPDERHAREEFDAVIDAAAAGDWEAIGLDPPPAAGDGPTRFRATTIDDFMRA